MTHPHPRKLFALAASIVFAATIGAYAQPAFMMPPSPPASLPSQENPAVTPGAQPAPPPAPIILTPSSAPSEPPIVRPTTEIQPAVRPTPAPIVMAPDEITTPADDCPTEPKLRVLCEHAWQMRVLEMQKERETFQFEIEKTRRDRAIRAITANPTPPATTPSVPAGPTATPAPSPTPPATRTTKIEAMPEPLPTTARIMAINGKFSATLRMPNTSVIDVQPGDTIANGWRITSITAEAVTITKGRETTKLSSTPRLLTPTSTGLAIESMPLAPPAGVNADPVQAPTYTLIPTNGTNSN